MNKATLKALKASIAHWRRMATGKEMAGERPGGEQCALCDKFADYHTGCDGCPVKEKTGLATCQGTPFYKAYNRYVFGTKKQFQSAAKKELAFLESLLPKQQRGGK